MRVVDRVRREARLRGESRRQGRKAAMDSTRMVVAAIRAGAFVAQRSWIYGLADSRTD